ncbi:hypothetical protein ACSBR2_028836 [Camellia fascicularis]
MSKRRFAWPHRPPPLGHRKPLFSRRVHIIPGRIIGTLPNSISQLKNLRFLGISRNFISSDIPASLGQIQGLRTLDLSFNQFSGTIPCSIGTLLALPNLILNNNRLSNSNPHFSSQSQTLTWLDFKYNNLFGSISSTSFPFQRNEV